MRQLAARSLPLFLVAGVGLLCACWRVSAQSNPSNVPAEPSTVEQNATLRYRRAYVPADSASSLARGYVPVKRSELENVLRIVEGRYPSLPNAVLVRAEYWAIFEQGQLHRGWARFDVDRLPESLALETAPALVIWPWGLISQEGFWLDSKESARLVANKEGKTVLLVPRTGTVLLRWNWAPGGAASIAESLSLPEAASCRLTLLVRPDDLSRVVPTATVSPARPSLPEWMPEEDRRAYQQALDSGYQMVGYQWSGASPIQILRPSYELRLPGLAWLRLVRHVQLSPASTQVQEDLFLEGLSPGLDHLEMLAPPELRLVQGRVGDGTISWEVHPSEDRCQRYRIWLPAGKNSGPLQIRLIWHTETVYGQPWTLPVWRLPAVQWIEGSLQVTISDALLASLLEPRSCALVARGESADGEQWEFRMYGPEATCQVALQARSPQLQVRAAVRLQLEKDAAYGTVVADFRALWGETDQLRVRLARPWSVDRVELQPPSVSDTLGSAWHWADGVLEIPLRAPLLPDNTVRLVLGCRAPVPPRRAGWSGAALRVVEFPNSTPAELVHLVSTGPSTRLQLANDLLAERLNPGDLQPEWRDRFGQDLNGLVLRLDPTSPATLFVTEETPEFIADVQVLVEVSEQEVRETYRIRCSCNAVAPRQLRVRLPAYADNSVSWRLEDPSDPIAARHIKVAGGESSESSWWELDLPVKLAKTFVVIGSREVFWNQQHPVALPLVDLAIFGSGQVLVQSRVPIHYQVQGVERLVSPEVLRRQGPFGALFEYDPAQSGSLTIRRSSLPQTNAWATQEVVTSQWFAGDRVVHQVDYQVFHDGQTRLRVAFSQPVQVDGVWLDGQPLSYSAGSVSEVSLDLPDSSRRNSISVRFTSPAGSGRYLVRLAAPWPSIDVPVLSRQWLVWVPKGFATLEPPLARRIPIPPEIGLEKELWSWFPWRRAGWNSTESTDAAEFYDRAREFLLWWGNLLIECSSWSELVSRADPSDTARETRGSSWRIFLDRSAWERIVGSPWPDASQAGMSRMEKAVAFFREADLCVVMFPQAIVITTPEAKGQYGPLHEENWPVCRAQTDGAHVDQLFSTDALAWGLLPMEVARYAVPGLKNQATAAYHQAYALGWTESVINPIVDQNRVVSLWIVDLRMAALCSLGLLMASAFFCVWLFQRWRWVFPAVAATGFALTLVVPAPWSTLVAAAVWGSLAGWGWVRLCAPGKALACGQSTALVAGCLVLFVGLVTSHSFAQTTSAPAPPATTPPGPAVREIIFPVESPGRPTGDYAYVPRSLYEPLMAIAAQQSRVDWWLVSAHHVVGPSNPVGSVPAGVLEMESRLVVQTLVPDQSIALEYHRAEVQLIQALVDRETVEIRWNNEGTHLLARIPTPGTHVMELRLAFRWPPMGDTWSCHIPACPRTELSSSGGVWDQWSLAVPHVVVEEPGDQRLLLGPVRILQLVKRPVPAEINRLRATQLVWLTIRPARPIMEWQLLVRDTATLPAHVELEVDPRLTLEQLVEPQSMALRQPDTPTQKPSRLSLPWARQDDGSALVRARFSIDARGLGEMAAPFIAPRNVVLDRWWMAIDAVDELSVQLLDGQKLGEPALAAFQADWQGMLGHPVHLVDLTNWNSAGSEQRPWPKIIVLPRWLPDEVEVRMQVAAYAAVLDIRWDASIRSQGSGELIRQIQIPSNFELTEVSLHQAGEPVSIRTLRHADGPLTVLLAKPLQGTYMLSLRGRVPVIASRATVPTVELSNSRITARNLLVVRHPDVASVTITGLDGWVADEIPPAEPFAWESGRFVGSWHWTAPAAPSEPLVLQVLPNPLDASGLLAMRVNRDEHGWFLDAEYLVRVSQGVIDVIRLAFPADWESPVELSPALSFRWERRVAEGQTVLLVWPAVPITSQFQLSLRSRLTAGSERVRRVPDIVPIDVVRSQRFVLLPTRLEKQLLTWTTSGLQERTLPSLFAMTNETQLAWQSYAVVANRFHASLERIERLPHKANVAVADVDLVWLPESNYAGVVSFDIEPGGLSQCGVAVPENVTWFKVYVDDVPQVPHERRGQVVQVALGPTQLPQRLEIAFRATAKANNNGYVLDVPWPENLSVTQTLLSMRSSWNERIELELPPGAVGHPMLCQQARLEAITRLLENGVLAASELGSEVLQNWLELWVPRVLWARQRASLALSAARLSAPGQVHPSARTASEVFQSWQQRWRQLQMRVPGNLLQQLSEDCPVAPQGIQAHWQLTSNVAERRDNWLVPGGMRSWKLRIAARQRPSTGRWIVATLLSALGIVGAVAARRLWLFKHLVPYRHGLLFLGGWLLVCCVRPIFWGILVIILAMVTPWLGHWRWRPPR